MMARQTRDQIKRLNKLTEAQAALGWGVILILGALLGTIYVTQASRIASVGRKVQELQIELITVKRENSDLEQSIAEAQSLERLQNEALRLGFRSPTPEEIEYLVVPDYPMEVDLDPLAPTPEATAVTAPPATMSEAIWLEFSNSITDFMQGEAREQ